MRDVSLGYNLECLSKAVLDGTDHWGVRTDRIDVHMHPQTWSDTSCGFGGMAGQVSCGAPTVVLIYGCRARVYHDGRLAYDIERYNKTFLEDLADRRLLGAEAYDLRYEQEMDDDQ